VIGSYHWITLHFYTRDVMNQPQNETTKQRQKYNKKNTVEKPYKLLIRIYSSEGNVDFTSI
jgi:hypothetical protein